MSKVPESYKRKLDRDAKIAAADEAAAKAAATVINLLSFLSKSKVYVLTEFFFEMQAAAAKTKDITAKAQAYEAEYEKVVTKVYISFSKL